MDSLDFLDNQEFVITGKRHEFVGIMIEPVLEKIEIKTEVVIDGGIKKLRLYLKEPLLSGGSDWVYKRFATASEINRLLSILNTTFY